MGEVHLDSENLFYGFGWTPSRGGSEQRREYLGFFAPPLRLEAAEDVAGVQSLARDAVRALMNWSRRHMEVGGSAVHRAISYGKPDAGVKAVRATLEREDVCHITVPWGRDRAEDHLLRNLDKHQWRRGPYVLGSSDAKVVRQVDERLASDPGLRAVVVMRPDRFASCRRRWFTAKDAVYPRLKEYGVGHVGLHLITNEWLAEQSALRRRRAPVLPVASGVPQPVDVWGSWSAHEVPPPRLDRPLSSLRWEKACGSHHVPDAVFIPLREAIHFLYRGAFEHGGGPVSWVAACRAAAVVPLVLRNLSGPPEGLTGPRREAFEEAWRRLMTRSDDDGEVIA